MQQLKCQDLIKHDYTCVNIAKRFPQAVDISVNRNRLRNIRDNEISRQGLSKSHVTYAQYLKENEHKEERNERCFLKPQWNF